MAGTVSRRVKAKELKMWICSEADTNALCDLGYVALPLWNFISSPTT